MNIYEDYFTNRDSGIQNSIQALREININFFYSPAHMEELAVIFRQENDFNKAKKYVYDRMVNISKLTLNSEFLPSDSCIISKKEHPHICFERVIKYYGATLFAEENEKFIFSAKNNNTLKEYFKNDNVSGIRTFEDIQRYFEINTKELNNYEPEDLFKSTKVISAFNYIIKDYGFSFDTLEKWENINASHRKIESIISLLYNFLEKIGYKAESIKKIRSRMHDVSHGIYGTASDMLVTGDQKFYEKTKAIYKLLEIPTIVFNKSEFKQYATSIQVI